MNSEAELAEGSAEELFEDAPCGYLSTRLDGTIIRVNRTFEQWTGRTRQDLVDRTRFQDLLSPGGRIYHETHYAPLLRMQGAVQEIAVEITRADGSLLPALVNSSVRTDEFGRPRVIRTTVFDATDRRRYEQELLRVTRREREIAHELQRSLLAGELPATRAVELDFFYAPAVTGTEVGGDWYDAFWLTEGRSIALVVGDVVGRGVRAAATMAQLRSAARAFAAAGLGPSGLLDALDAFSRRHHVGEMTTVIYAELDLQTRCLRYARAGHPPLLIAPPGEAARFASDGASLPLHAFGERHTRPEGTCALEPGATIVLYTDGLVEDRARPQDDGMARLSDLVSQARAQPLPDLIRAVTRAASPAAHADDVCLLAARLAA